MLETKRLLLLQLVRFFIYFENFHVHLICFLDGVVRDYGGVDILLTSAGVADNVSYYDYLKQLFSCLLLFIDCRRGKKTIVTVLNKKSK